MFRRNIFLLLPYIVLQNIFQLNLYVDNISGAEYIETAAKVFYASRLPVLTGRVQVQVCHGPIPVLPNVILLSQNEQLLCYAELCLYTKCNPA